MLIFSKPTPDDLTLAKESKAEGIKIIADIGDDHFLHETWGPIYREMVTLADALVTPTENQASRIKRYTGRTVDAIIPDPYEEALTLPHANDARKFIWFGHPVNLKDLKPWLDEYLRTLDITIVTAENHGLVHDYLRWSPAVQTAQLHLAHIAIFPTRKGHEYKSPNRVVNALRAGCFPVCGLHPAYTEFKEFIWQGNFATGLRWAQHFRADLNDRVAEGQRYVEKFSPENVGKRWRQLIETVCA